MGREEMTIFQLLAGLSFGSHKPAPFTAKEIKIKE